MLDIDTLIKIALTLIGAFVGAAVSTYVSRRRLSNLVPLVLAQLSTAADSCILVYSVEEASACSHLLEAAARLASEFVASEIGAGQWSEASKAIRETQSAISQAVAGGSRDAARTTVAVRQKGANLQAWLATLGNAGQG